MIFSARFTAPAGPAALVAAGLLAFLLAGCGAGSNPIDNPPSVQNPQGAGGQKLSFAYFQRCVQPILIARLQVNQNGAISTNTCASGGCHDTVTGTGGALRLVGGAAPVDLANPPAPDAIRATDMYKNFYSSQGEVVFGAPLSSRLLTKPLVLNVLHGGGQIFTSETDPNVLVIRYWISRPMPQGQDEFSTAANAMFAGGDPVAGACLTQ